LKDNFDTQNTGHIKHFVNLRPENNADSLLIMTDSSSQLDIDVVNIAKRKLYD